MKGIQAFHQLCSERRFARPRDTGDGDKESLILGMLEVEFCSEEGIAISMGLVESKGSDVACRPQTVKERGENDGEKYENPSRLIKEGVS